MRKISFVLSAAIACLGISSPASASSFQIGAGLFNPANGHTYYVIGENDLNSTLTWDNAEVFAQLLGGHLAEINNAAENTFVFGMFATYSGLLAANSQQTDFWYFGLTDVAVDGIFRWVIDGSTAPSATNPYVNWSGGEPNGGTAENWVGMLNVAGGPWNDGSNGHPGFRYSSIAEVSAVPEPSSLLLLGTGVVAVMNRRRRHQAK